MGKIWTPDGTEAESQGQGGQQPQAVIKYLMENLNQCALMIQRLTGVVVATEERVKELEDMHRGVNDKD